MTRSFFTPFTLEGLSGTWQEFRGNRTFTGNTFTLKPLETIVATNVTKGADLPTYAEVKAMIEELEYKRTHTGNLLLERAGDVTVTTSERFRFVVYKLFDGALDNLAGYINDKEDNFIEVDVTKVKPLCSKIVLRGFNIEEATLKFRIGGELTDAAVAETTIGEYAKTYLLAKPVTPDAIRFEFQGKKVELYEIEAF